MVKGHEQIAPARFGFAFAELIAIGAVIWFFGLEQLSGLFQLLPIIVVGFAVHSFLPLRFRPAFFLALSLLGIVVVVPPPHGVAIVLIGLAIIGISHLPVRLGIRVAILLVIGTVFALIRSGVIITKWEGLGVLVLPIVGSIFMFRLIIYLHDIRFEKDRPPLWHRLSYFFMLPNVCFLLFPVVDYQTYKKKYYDEPAERIYRKGTWWMFRGVTHLLLYRLIYLNAVPSAAEAAGIWGVAQAMVTTYLLYLRISGQFHLIAGIMCLFGHNFLETNHLYYLASSASDYWRRINIYWKDFMTKIFYNHAFVRLKKFGVMNAVMLSLVYVFVATWALHSYQWLWLKGDFPMAAKDIIFWGSFMLLAMGGVYFEMTRRGVRNREVTFRTSLVHSGKVLFMFITIALLWSLWSSSSLSAFAALLAEATKSDVVDYLLFVAVLAAIVVLGASVRVFVHLAKSKAKEMQEYRWDRFWWYPIGTSMVLLAILFSNIDQVLPERAAQIVQSASDERLNRIDEEVLEAGYYETLLEPTDYLRSLWTNNRKRPPGWNTHLYDHGAARYTNDLMGSELVPSVSIVWHKEQFTTNEWGMRDKSYSEKKPENTVRVALFGSSKEMGWGVGDHDTFQSILEEKLNASFADSISVEILNIAVQGYTEIQFVSMMEDGILDRFDVDMIIVCSHIIWKEKIADVIRRAKKTGADLRYPVLQRAADEVGIDGSRLYREFDDEFEPYGSDIARWAYGRMADLAEETSADTYLLLLPSVNREEANNDGVDELRKIAGEYGFDVLDLRDAYGNSEEIDLRLTPWDSHPNERAHALIARALLPQMSDLLSDVSTGTDGNEYESTR